MILGNQTQNLGALLFKFRGQIPVILVFLILPLSYFFPYTLTPYFISKFFLDFIIIFSLLGGVFLRIWTTGFRQEHTSGRNRHQQVAHVLNTTGVYSLCQHPLYFANGLLWFGVLLFFENISVLVLGIFCYCILTCAIIKEESAFLSLKFGEVYFDWKNKTSIILPRISRFKSENRPFNLPRVLATEYPCWTSIFAILLLLDVCKNYYVYNVFAITKFDFSLVVLGLFVGLTGRFVKYVLLRKWLKMSI